MYVSFAVYECMSYVENEVQIPFRGIVQDDMTQAASTLSVQNTRYVVLHLKVFQNCL